MTAATAAPFWRVPAARGPGGLSVLVVYWATPGGTKDRTWNDGFIAALRELAQRGHRISFVNAHCDDAVDAFAARHGDADVVLAKSNWGWIVDRFVRRHTTRAAPARAIMVSGISDPISYRRGRFYDTVFYQTEWYRHRLSERLHLVHAYGINTKAMHPPADPVEAEWDWLYVGALTANRRPDRLLDKTGRRLAVGDVSSSTPTLVDRLREGGVVVRDYVPYDELRSLYWSAERLYVPAALDGGGERQLMEAIACGRPVEVEPDNPKLAEVVAKAASWTEAYFADQLERGLTEAVERASRSRARRLRTLEARAWERGRQRARSVRQELR